MLLVEVVRRSVKLALNMLNQCVVVKISPLCVRFVGFGDLVLQQKLPADKVFS